MLSNDAFNALLKTFEEPPKNVIFILATTEPHKVLETIVSRCQRFDLRRITTEDIIKRLRQISDIENIKITDEALFTIAKNVSGGLRDSLALLDQVSILGVKEEITKELIEDLLGKINFDVLLKLLKNINDENIELSLYNVDEIYAKGNEPRNLAENFIEFLRNVVLVLNSQDNNSITKFTTLINEDIEKIRNSNFNKDKILKILNTIIEYYKEIKISTNPYLWMELSVIAACKTELKETSNNSTKISFDNSISKPKPQITTESSINKIEIKEKKQEINKIEKEEEQPTKNNEEKEQPKNSDNYNEAEIWTNIVNAVPSLPAKAFYSGVARLVKIENKKITLGFLNENLITQAKSDSKLPQLKTAIENTYKDFEYEFIKIDANSKTLDVKPKITPNIPKRPPENPIESPKQTENSENPINQEEQKTNEKKYYSPKVQEMIEQFSGKIID